MTLQVSRWRLWGLAVIAAATLAACTPMEAAQPQASQEDESSLRELIANDRQQIEALQQQVAQENDRIAELEHNQMTSATPPARPNPPPSQAPPSPPTSEAAAIADAGTQSGAAASPGATASPGAEASPAAEDENAAPENDNGAATGAAAGGAENTTAMPPSSEMAAATPPTPAAPETAPQPAPLPPWQDEAKQQLDATPNAPGAKLYRAGLADLTAGRYAQGLAKLQDLQRRYPKSDLSEPAEYFSGNALYELGQSEKAILQFNDLTMRFPEGKYTSSALLREAQAFTKINDPIDARLTLQKLLTDHPNSPEAPAAKSMMASLTS
ncbi:MAG TPA: outer membrane protein assembly factor BamD [Candidatus Binataceae bacterium]|nr:outer membrane protein assembly factor BamD [Candidatus Binataceae bacterium]